MHLYGQFGSWLARPYDQVAGPTDDKHGAFPLDVEHVRTEAKLGNSSLNEESTQILGQTASFSANQEPAQLINVERGTSWTMMFEEILICLLLAQGEGH